MAYQLCAVKMADMLGNYLETCPGPSWSEFKAQMDRFYAEAVDPMEALQRLWTIRQLEGESVEEYKYKAISLFNKVFVVVHNKDPEIEKHFLCIFRRCLQSKQVQTQIIR